MKKPSLIVLSGPPDPWLERVMRGQFTKPHNIPIFPTWEINPDTKRMFPMVHPLVTDPAWSLYDTLRLTAGNEVPFTWAMVHDEAQVLSDYIKNCRTNPASAFEWFFLRTMSTEQVGLLVELIWRYAPFGMTFHDGDPIFPDWRIDHWIAAGVELPPAYDRQFLNAHLPDLDLEQWAKDSVNKVQYKFIIGLANSPEGAQGLQAKFRSVVAELKVPCIVLHASDAE